MSKWLASCIQGGYDTDYILKIKEDHYEKCKQCNQDYKKLKKDEELEGYYIDYDGKLEVLTKKKS